MVRDRDFNNIPDWQEDARYYDEAPIRGRRKRPSAGTGCTLLLPLLPLLLAAGLVAHVLARLIRRPA